ncbi:MAG: hypothetical protein ACTSVO_05260 [Candidatus Heimdallarchaeaceae archaeon]
MRGKYSTDILIEGDGISASALAYYMSLNNPNEDITLLQREDRQNTFSFLTPSILLLVPELESSLMAKAFSKSGLLLEELKSITSQFELSKNPLAMLFRTKNSIDLKDKFLAKIADTNIKHINYSSEDVARNYSFINRQNDVFLTEVFDSYTCSDIYNLIATYKKVAEENNVQIISASNDMKYDESDNSIITKDYTYNARNLIISTSIDLLQDSSYQEMKGFKVSTPIIEKFPRISLYDVDTKSSMWLEEAGYFHIFRLFSDINPKEAANETKALFSSIFPHIDALEIVDELFAKVNNPDLSNESIKKHAKSKIIQFLLPLQYEFSLAPILASNLSNLVSNQEKETLDRITTESVIKN